MILLGTLVACSDPAPPPKTAPATLTAAQTAPSPELALASQPGRDAYEQHCAACHAAGDGHPGTMRLALRADPAPAVLLERSDLEATYVAQVVRSGLGMMPPFRPTEISDAELEQLAGFVARAPAPK